jgi:hypothetical protein
MKIMSFADFLYRDTKGRMARSILKEIYSDLDDLDVSAISMVLVCHLMIEERLNDLLFYWMFKSIPQMGSIENPGDVLNNEKARNQLEENIINFGFAKKVELIKPLATTLWREDGQEKLDEISEINKTRNAIFNRINIKERKFKNILLSTEEGIKLFHETSDRVMKYIDDLIELISI